MILNISINSLAPFDKNLSAKEFESEFLNIIESLGIYPKLVNRTLSLEENVKSFNLFLETIHEILYLIQLNMATLNFPLSISLVILELLSIPPALMLGKNPATACLSLI